MNNAIIFGSINVETGEVREGYIDKDGKMAYRPLPWYKRLFLKKMKPVVEYAGCTKLFRRNHFNGNKTYFDIAVYKERNPYTGKVIAVYSNTSHGKFYFDATAFETKNLFVPIQDEI